MNRRKFLKSITALALAPLGFAKLKPESPPPAQTAEEFTYSWSIPSGSSWYIGIDLPSDNGEITAATQFHNGQLAEIKFHTEPIYHGQT